MGIGKSPAAASHQQRPYRCFLVRCRLEENAAPTGEPIWRFSVEEVGPQAARRAFACLEDFKAYLDTELGTYKSTQ
jgi:hypothetical protein